MTDRPNTESLERALEAAREKIGRLERALLPSSATRPAVEGELFCCHLVCEWPAEYEIHHGYGPDDYTHACAAHVVEMLTDALCNRVYTLNPDFGARPHLVVIDDPQGPTAGGTLEAHVQNEETGEWSRDPGKDIAVAGTPRQERRPKGAWWCYCNPDAPDTPWAMTAKQEKCDNCGRPPPPKPEPSAVVEIWLHDRDESQRIIALREHLDPRVAEEFGYGRGGLRPVPRHGKRDAIMKAMANGGHWIRWGKARDWSTGALNSILGDAMDCRCPDWNDDPLVPHPCDHKFVAWRKRDGQAEFLIKPFPRGDAPAVEPPEPGEVLSRWLEGGLEWACCSDYPYEAATEACAECRATRPAGSPCGNGHVHGPEWWGRYCPKCPPPHVTVELRGREADPMVYLREALNTRMAVPPSLNELVIPVESAGTDAAIAVFDGKDDERWAPCSASMEPAQLDALLGRGVVPTGDEYSLATSNPTHRVIAYRLGRNSTDVLVQPVAPTIVSYDLSTGPDWTSQLHVSMLAFPPGMVTAEGHLIGVTGDPITEGTIEGIISGTGAWVDWGPFRGTEHADALTEMLGQKFGCDCHPPDHSLNLVHKAVAWRTRGDVAEVLVKPMENAPPADVGKALLFGRNRGIGAALIKEGGGCTLAAPGRGDCENSVGLPGKSVPGQHDGDDDTVNAYGKPNGWCWPCWKSQQIRGLREALEEYRGERSYFEKGIENDARLAGIDTRGVVGLALVHMMVEEIEKLRGEKP